MKKILCLLMALAPMVSFADDSPKDTKFNLNIRRVGLDWSKTSVENAEDYQDSSIAALKANDQENIKGVFDVALEYGFDRFKWDNSLFMEYGKQKIKPYNDKSTVDESADKILFSSDLAYACWDFDSFKIGPIMRVQYETEFVADPRRKNVRPNAGFSLFDHDIVKSLYIVGVYEYDFTESDATINKSAVEGGWRIEYQIREGVKFSTNGYYRKYLSFSQDSTNNYTYDLFAEARLDTNVWGDLTMGPYVKYRRAHAKGIPDYGANTSIGVSFSYIHNFDLMYKKSE